MSRKISLQDRIAYHMSFSLAERLERFKDRAARFVAWHCLPRRVAMWSHIKAHAALTTGENGHRHPDSVTAFEVQHYYAKKNS